MVQGIADGALIWVKYEIGVPQRNAKIPARHTRA
jgi:hypothetical protein